MGLVTVGKTLVCEISDFDACDKYLFRVEKVEASLVVTWKLKGCDESGVLDISSGALATGTRLFGFSQGNVSRWQGDVSADPHECEASCGCHTPPFMLGRAAFGALQAGKPIELNVFGSVSTFAPTGKRERREIEVEGKTSEVDCLHAHGTEGDLWVVDNALFPLILRVETDGGGNYAELRMLSDLPPDALEATLDDAQE